MIGHCDALGTLSALGPWLDDGDGDDDLDGSGSRVAGRGVGSLEVAGLVGMMMMMNRGEMPRMLCD